MRGYNISWTEDLDIVRSLIDQPEVLDYVKEDDEDIVLAINSSYIKYAVVTLADKPVGVFLFIKRLKLVWEVHTCLTLECRGRPALLAAKAVLALLFRDTDAECVTTFVPETYSHVRNFTVAAGLTHSGYVPNSFYRNGVLQGLHSYYVLRGAFLCQ
jgi:hypothetical protein